MRVRLDQRPLNTTKQAKNPNPTFLETNYTFNKLRISFKVNFLSAVDINKSLVFLQKLQQC